MAFSAAPPRLLLLVLNRPFLLIFFPPPLNKCMCVCVYGVFFVSSLFSYWYKFSMNAPIRWAFHFHACHLQQLAFWSFCAWSLQLVAVDAVDVVAAVVAIYETLANLWQMLCRTYIRNPYTFPYSISYLVCALARPARLSDTWSSAT